MQNNFVNPFDLSTCDHNEKYYHWCTIQNKKVIIQNKNLKNLNDVKNDILDKKTEFDSVKVIRTLEPFEAILDYFNKKDSNILLTYDDESLFLLEHPFLSDVTKDIIRLCDNV